LFQSEYPLLKKWVKDHANQDLELITERKAFQQLYEDLELKVKSQDQSLAQHVGALAKKQVNSLAQLVEKLIRAERKKQETAAARIQFLKASLFPDDGLQERTQNFSRLYLAYGEEFISNLMNELHMPATQFKILHKKNTIR
jgi:uncharacterized protein YllA (UPF0747 family)